MGNIILSAVRPGLRHLLCFKKVDKNDEQMRGTEYDMDCDYDDNDVLITIVNVTLQIGILIVPTYCNQELS